MVRATAAAYRICPELASLVRPPGVPGTRALTVVAAGEPGGDVTIASGGRRIVRGPDGRLGLTCAPGDGGFAAALIAAEERDAVPAGDDPATLALLTLAARVAAHDVAVLITGPTGSGKEGLARFVHARSARAAAPFVAVNCAAIPETMLEATLFGHERGAFTGASVSSPGLFRAAAGGTLLLDEVSELPLALQPKLLRALQEREVLPVGAVVPVPVDVRIVATANRDLSAEVAAGRFRADLYYRLAVFPLATTALASRPVDIVAIAAALWLRLGSSAWLTPAALAKLVAHRWPGNVRELANVLARAAILADDGAVGADAIVFDAAAAPVRLDCDVRAHEATVIRRALAACSGRRAETAARLGISARTLRYKLAAMTADPAMTLQ